MKVIDLYHFIPEVSSQNVICTHVCSLEQSYYSKVILKQNKKFVLKSANKIKSRVFAKKTKNNEIILEKVILKKANQIYVFCDLFIYLYKNRH